MKIQIYKSDEKVLIRRRFLATPAIVLSDAGDDFVLVAIAPESNHTQDLTNIHHWEKLSVPRRSLRRYIW